MFLGWKSSEKCVIIHLLIPQKGRKDSIDEYLLSIQQAVGMISRYFMDSLDSVALTEGGVLRADGSGVQELPGRSDAQRQDAKSVSIIALSANAFAEDVQQSLQAGMNAHLSKPVDPDRLFEELRKIAAEKHR